ncbi:hypothetical protein B9T33_01920 [Acinetobacter sp. ANC 5054]|uniref:DUF924 family protein n=1 Tax=Acinetobacter sp. ANC 5054 TaxID=1977877 RepID=UPI000A346304|nr:DUF924 family protein [Acinetobacter sp. ANC 5054]OTG84563.1 hypothetical protein B9T33_01920 [Acinetobacter sp. ANC 5054]
MNYQDILDFWFNPEQQPNWFAKSNNFDVLIEKKFKELHQQACQSELWTWRSSAERRLAEIIVLDQFSRNLYRDSPHAFAQDAMALALAQETVAQGLDRNLAPVQRSFLYMPYMHSESAKIHQIGLELFEQLGNPINLEFEKKHKVIIDRFGRYPHRNKVLGRTSTTEELEFLTQPNSSF